MRGIFRLSIDECRKFDSSCFCSYLPVQSYYISLKNETQKICSYKHVRNENHETFFIL